MNSDSHMPARQSSTSPLSDSCVDQSTTATAALRRFLKFSTNGTLIPAFGSGSSPVCLKGGEGAVFRTSVEEKEGQRTFRRLNYRHKKQQNEGNRASSGWPVR